MKIILFRRCDFEGKPENIKRFTKTVESTIIPQAGDKYYEEYFGLFKYIPVKEVLVNYEKDEYYVLLQKYTFTEKNSEKSIGYFQELIEHGWSLYKE